MNKTVVHAIAGTLALLLVASFWTATLVSELFLDADAVVAVKQTIARYGLVALVVAMAATGGSGFSLGKNRKGRLVEEKKKRMPIIGANGLLVMIPSALFLSMKATAGEFDTLFYGVQAIELIVGVVQLTLLGRNFRSGLRLTGRLRVAPPK
jgi:sorbitol-specific phosphotransferase system component IIC